MLKNIIFYSLFITIILPNAGLSAFDYYVAKNGDDNNPGSIEKPFATFERARDAVREWKQQFGMPPDTVTVWIRGGVYEIRKSFLLDNRDSGIPGAPIVYRAYPEE